MDVNLTRSARIRREKKNFVVEQNVDAVQWPAECAACGLSPTVKDTIKLEKKFKNFGLVKTGVNGIPYCDNCYRKVKSTKRLDKLVNVLAMVFGIPLGLLLAALMAKQPGTRIICLGLLVAVGVGIAYGFFYLLIRFPVKAIFKSSFADHVDAWLVEEKKPDGSDGLSVAINIPRAEYAEKFAALNNVSPGDVT